MSMDRCHKCDALIDTDKDVGAYDGPNPFIAFCKACRDEEYERREYEREEAADFKRRQRKEDRMIERIERGRA